MKFLNWTRSSQKPTAAQAEAANLRRLAVAVAGATSLQETADVVAKEGQTALEADAVCVYVRQPEGHYDLISQLGCTPEYLATWSRIESENPFVSENSTMNDFHFFSYNAFGNRFPLMMELLKNSGRNAIAIAPLVINGKILGILAFSYNRPRKRPEDMTFVMTLIHLCSLALERSRLFEREFLARKQAESSNQAKTQFLANISHEIRSPIGLIQGFADILVDSVRVNERERRWLSIMRKATRQLTGIIGDVLDLSKIEAKKIEIEIQPVDFPEVLEEVQMMARLKVHETKLDLQFHYSDLPKTVKTDSIRLKQILNNLVGNSVKFTKQGFVHVDVQYIRPSRLEVTVEDSGIGIPAHQHETIFEPFVQSDTSRNFGGAGLGLSISKALAQKLGGDVILLSSEENGGAKFQFVLECEMSDSEPDQDSATEVTAAAEAELVGISVLLVDDSIDNRELLGLFLSDNGANVTLASSGREALDEAANARFDVVLMDIQMPELDGNQTLKLLRDAGYFGPIAALTANALQTERDRSLILGFDEYLTKPVDFPRLFQAIKRMSRSKYSQEKVIPSESELV